MPTYVLLHIQLVITTLQSVLWPNFSHPIQVAGVNFILEWQDLQFNVDSE